jgi:hypothetical protein
MGRSSPILYKTSSIYLGDYNMLDLPEILYENYGEFAPTIDPDMFKHEQIINENNSLVKDPFQLNSYKALHIWIEMERCSAQDCKLDLLMTKDCNIKKDLLNQY